MSLDSPGNRGDPVCAASAHGGIEDGDPIRIVSAIFGCFPLPSIRILLFVLKYRVNAASYY